MKLTESIKQLIREKQSSMTQAEIGEKIGVRQSTINAWLNGVIEDLRASNARKLCAFLGMDYEAEMRRQKSALNKVTAPQPSVEGTNVNGENHGTAIQNIGVGSPPDGAFTPLEIVRKVSTCQATDEEKGTTISVLGRCGIL